MSQRAPESCPFPVSVRVIELIVISCGIKHMQPCDQGCPMAALVVLASIFLNSWSFKSNADGTGSLSVQLSTYLPTEGGIKAVFPWNIFNASPGSSIHLYFPCHRSIRDIFNIRRNKGTSHSTGRIINRFTFTFKCQKSELTRTQRESLIKCLYLYSLALPVTRNTPQNSKYEKFMKPDRKSVV